MAGVKSVGTHAFVNCKQLGWMNWPAAANMMLDSTFENCENLAGISGIANVGSVGARAFANNKQLQSIVWPSNAPLIDDYTFYDCKRLTSIQNLQGVVRVEAGAFVNCYLLPHVDLPTGTLVIGSNSSNPFNGTFGWAVDDSDPRGYTIGVASSYGSRAFSPSLLIQSMGLSVQSSLFEHTPWEFTAQPIY